MLWAFGERTNSYALLLSFSLTYKQIKRNKILKLINCTWSKTKTFRYTLHFIEGREIRWHRDTILGEHIQRVEQFHSSFSFTSLANNILTVGKGRNWKQNKQNKKNQLNPRSILSCNTTFCPHILTSKYNLFNDTKAKITSFHLPPQKSVNLFQ